MVTVPAGYNLLRLVVIGASSHASESDRFNVTVNAVSSGYDTQSAYGQNTSAAAGVQGNAAIWQGPTNDIPAASATSGVAGILDLQIPAYAATTFDKIGLWRSGYSDAATAAGDQLAQQNIVSLRSGTAAITSITVTLGLGGNFVTGTTALLYLS